MFVRKNAEVVGNGRGALFAQVAEGGEYRCWKLDPRDASQFRLREHDEIVIECLPADQSYRVASVGSPDE
jgi:hypothetical protein